MPLPSEHDQPQPLAQRNGVGIVAEVEPAIEEQAAGRTVLRRGFEQAAKLAAVVHAFQGDSGDRAEDAQELQINFGATSVHQDLHWLRAAGCANMPQVRYEVEQRLRKSPALDAKLLEPIAQLPDQAGERATRARAHRALCKK